MNTRLVFHHVIGQSIKLSEDRLSACRKNPIEEYENAWVFSEKCITENEEFQIQILHLISSHNQSLQFGITVENPEDLKQAGLLSQNEIFKNSWMLQNDKIYYQNDDNIITVEEYDINLSLLQEGDLIGLKINENRELCFTHNGITYPSAAEDIPQNVWVFVNLYGRCSFITIISPKSPITRSQKDKMIKKLKLLKENDRKHEEYEICFHSYCGKEVCLSENNRVAQRKNPTNEFRNAVIISNRPLITNKPFKLRIEGLVNKWNGSIEFGVTIHNPDSFELPATMTNLRSGTLVLSGNSILTNGHGNQLPYSTTGLDDLKIGDEICVMRNSNGDINFFINEKDLGVAGNIPIATEIWVIIDLYGRTIKVTIPSSQPKSALLNLENDLILYSQEVDDKLAFHPICGRNVLITQDGYSASRINDHEFNNGVVFTNRPIQIGERWTVKLVRCVEQWAGNLEMGITTLIPNELDIPSTMTDLNIGYTAMLTTNGLVINGCPLSQSAQSLNLENVHSVLLSGISSLIENSTLGVELISRDKLQFFINNADLGIITLQTDKDVYGVVDLYGKAAEVSIYLKETYNRSLQIKDTLQSPSVNNNDLIGNEIGRSGDDSLYSDDNSDCDRQIDRHSSANAINHITLETDRSFPRLLTTDDVFSEEVRSPGRKVLRFHDIHGRNVFLSNEGRTAYRPSPNNEFKNALVMSSRSLSTNELFEICVEKMTDHWSGSLEMGVTLIRPEELNFPGTLSQLDKDCWILSGSCLMNNGITARNDYGLDMDGIRVNSKIGLVRRQNGMLHFLLDGVDMGPAYFDVPTGIYVILDLYGQCSQVSITRRSGISLSSEHAIVNVNPISKLSNSLSTRDHQESIYNMDNESNFQSSQHISAFKITMSAIKKNLTNTSGISSHSKPTKSTFKDKPVIDDLNSSSNFSEKILRINSFFCETICGPGVTSDGLGHFHIEDQNQNCTIYFKQSMKTNFYYELLFLNNKKNDYNLETISLGMTCDKLSVDNYLPGDLSLVKSTNWVINEGALFINSVLRCQTFASGLNLFKNRLSVGIYFYDNSNVEIFIDHVSVGKVISDIHKECYLMINLRGWYNILVGMRISPKPNNSLSQPKINLKAPNYLYKNQVDTENSSSEMFHEQHLLDLDENLDIEDPFIVTIVNELSQLLPQFFVIMHGIDTLKLTEKIININNDIVLCVRNRLMTKHLIKRYSNATILKMEIQNQLIEELSNRFSHLSELKSLGNSKYEIARTLRRRIFSHQIEYDDRKIASILPNSCLNLEESRITRFKSGCEFGLCILNHELKSQKLSSYEIQISDNESINETEFKNYTAAPIIGFILLENSNFLNIEDAFRFLMNIPCTKRLNLLRSSINEYLELVNFEAKSAVLTIEEDCVYFNEKKICRNMPFNMKNVSATDYLSFVTFENECAIGDIYLSVRKIGSTVNYKVFSDAWLEQSCVIETIYSTRTIYYYVPFVWLANESVITVATDAKKKMASGTDIRKTSQPDWLEKHYHDGLNKESTQLEVSDSFILNKPDQQCISIVKSMVIRKALTLPDVYFHNKLVECYCKHCYHPINVSNAEQVKEFRLPYGWVKHNIRMRKDDKCISLLWKVAYLTVPLGLLYRLLTSTNPNIMLASCTNTSNPQMAWLKSPTNSAQLAHKSIIVSPWQPLGGCFLSEDSSIKQCTDCLINCYDSISNSEIKAKIALEIRVKPNSYKNIECKVVSENQTEIKRFIPKDTKGNFENKKLSDYSVIRPINPKTIWILNGEENSVLISGLLVKI